MKVLTVLALALLLSSAVMAVPGDIIRNQTLTGQPTNGVRGLARDWNSDNVYVAGPAASDQVMYATMDINTMDTGTWQQAIGQYWVFDIACGFDYDTYSDCLIMNDQSTPFSKVYESTGGTYLGSLPDYYSAANYTDGAAVCWDNNYVFLSSYGDADVVNYDGSSYSTFANIPGALNMGVAIGWGHVFVIRTSTFYTIEVYMLDGTFVESIPLNDYSASNYLVGLSCGREDAVDDNESLFFASFSSLEVYEVEVGNYTGSALQSATWGEIKGSFR